MRTKIVKIYIIIRDLLLVGHIPGLPREVLISTLPPGKRRERAKERRDVIGVSARSGGYGLLVASDATWTALAGLVALDGCRVRRGIRHDEVWKVVAKSSLRMRSTQGSMGAIYTLLIFLH